ncbi:MAG: hypothetical protein M1815_004767 [Lichina confinis]|nr:MAG: hypothetical protein M1815_004767 [Lichina confinis]
MAKSYNPFNRLFYREDRVPHYQRMYLQNKNQRLWSRTPAAKYYLIPFKVMFWGSFAGEYHCDIVLG